VESERRIEKPTLEIVASKTLSNQRKGDDNYFTWGGAGGRETVFKGEGINGEEEGEIRCWRKSGRQGGSELPLGRTNSRKTQTRFACQRLGISLRHKPGPSDSALYIQLRRGGRGTSRHMAGDRNPRREQDLKCFPSDLGKGPSDGKAERNQKQKRGWEKRRCKLAARLRGPCVN